MEFLCVTIIIFPERLNASFKKIGMKQLCDISNSWGMLKAAGQEHGMSKNNPDWFDQVLKRQRETHPCIRKMLY